MLTTVALVGRPNVGKSTLFNALTRTRDALVADLPGLTRDRRYGYARLRGRDVVVVDTGGLSDANDPIARLVADQAALAIGESDVVVLVLDARAGLTGADQGVADQLRRSGKPLVVAANKVDGLDETTATSEFHALGIGEPLPIAALHRRGIGRLAEVVAGLLPQDAQPPGERAGSATRVCVIGRPNTGKSTLVNRLAGEARVLAHDMPGTTRDSVEVPFEHGGREYVLIDTAGIRRRSRVTEAIEKFSIIKSLEAIADSDVAIVLLDANTGVSDQDATLLGLVLDGGRAPVITFNKWDVASRETRASLRVDISRKLAFAAFCPVRRISALRGTGLRELMRQVDDCRKAAFADLSASRLTRELERAVDALGPSAGSGAPHQAALRPTREARIRRSSSVHGNQTDLVPASYRRYLAGRFRSAFTLVGTPLRIEFPNRRQPVQGKTQPPHPPPAATAKAVDAPRGKAAVGALPHGCDARRSRLRAAAWLCCPVLRCRRGSCRWRLGRSPDPASRPP